ncbi:D-tyrosyl-tRNA(Tyr) deacylase [Patescibacteria group bacterium]|nr:D-tyrosyl-tRNA(Tyr) deacylase [Patescibacteria group bacterium]
MRATIQRVSQAKVAIEGKTISSISQGLVVLFGVGQDDTEQDLDWLVKKLTELRIFSDEQGKMNLSIIDAKGELLLISQFTLYADTNNGRRPSFIQAADPELAKRMYELAIQKLTGQGIQVSTGQFGAYMDVHLSNDGPVTINLDSKK